MYAKIENNIPVEWPVRDFQIRSAMTTVSLPAQITPEDVAPLGFEPYAESEKPEFDPLIQDVREVAPVKQGDLWAQSWEVVELYDTTKREQVLAEDAAKKAEEAKAALVASYDQALSNHLDFVAQSKRYDTRITCAVRAGYPGPFQAEGAAFAAWMDDCNAQAYRMWAEIEAGTRLMFADTAEFIAALPPMVWPA
jgi:hypothetical protein